ncbi:hypothetical protein ThvES_00003090 [Thiovulum sp. ES]|nr:hypothetical protein ThvES_00003090 [Thiovulum sp. ES]
MRITFIFFFLITVVLSANNNIRIVGFNVKERDSRVDLAIAFSDQYNGRVTRQVGDTLTKLIIDNARLDRSDTRVLNSNTVISKIDLLPYDDRVELVLSVMGKAKIIYRKVDGGYGIIIEIHDTTFSNDNEVIAEGQSAFDSLSAEYFFTLIILLIIVILLFFIKKNVERKNEERLQRKSHKTKTPLDNMDMLLDSTPPINNGNLLDRVQPPPMDFPRKKNTNSQRNSNSIGNGIGGDSFELGNPPVKKSEGGLRKYSQSAGRISILSEETTEIGRIAVLQIDDVKYTIMEAVNGTITLLNKEGLSQKSRNSIKREEERDYRREERDKEDLRNFFRDSKNLNI